MTLLAFLFGFGLWPSYWLAANLWNDHQRRKSCDHIVTEIHGDARNLFNTRWICWHCGKKFREASK